MSVPTPDELEARTAAAVASNDYGIVQLSTRRWAVVKRRMQLGTVILWKCDPPRSSVGRRVPGVPRTRPQPPDHVILEKWTLIRSTSARSGT
jgi:hypothetical protein